MTDRIAPVCLSEDEIIEAIVSEMESDEASQPNARLVLRACIDAIYGPPRYSQVKEALSGLRPGPWMDRVECVVCYIGDEVLSAADRGQLLGALSLMRFHLASRPAG